MSLFVAQIVFDLLQFRRAPLPKTEIFARLMHNADLCPRFQQKLELVLESYRKYQQITYDIQGFRDRGSDVIIKQGNDSETEFICLQIKSESDLDTSDYMTKLKAQSFETQSTYQNLLDYYVVLCCNLSKDDTSFRKRQDQIRTISAEIAIAKNIHVIEPQYALGFLQLNSIQIDAAIKAKLGVDDIVFRQATELLQDLSPTERALLFRIVYLTVYSGESSLTVDEMLVSSRLREIYDIVPDRSKEWFEEMWYPEDDWDDWDQYDDKEKQASYVAKKAARIAELEKERGLGIESRVALDLDALEGIFIRQSSDNEYTLDMNSAEAVAALMLDGRIRYKYEGDELLDYFMNLFGPMVGYDPAIEDING